MKNSAPYNEMLVHIPLCTHKDPKNIMIFSDDKEGVLGELHRHIELQATCMPVSKLSGAISDAADDSFDVVIFDAPLSTDKTFLAHLSRVTTTDALIVFKQTALMEQLTQTRTLMQELAKYFKIIMPYNFDATTQGTARETLMLASKLYHPTADIILHRTDLLDGLSYYNCDIHPSAFAQPNYLRTALKGVAKN